MGGILNLFLNFFFVYGRGVWPQDGRCGSSFGLMGGEEGSYWWWPLWRYGVETLAMV